MPFAYLKDIREPKILDLEERLLQEWRHPQKGRTEPVIIEERAGSNDPPDIYVIWQEWADLSRWDRSKIIRNAYERRYGKDETLNIIVAMGFTADEAEQVGIKYAPLEAAA